jgi:hypothetical protein
MTLWSYSCERSAIDVINVYISLCCIKEIIVFVQNEIDHTFVGSFMLKQEISSESSDTIGWTTLR